MPEHSLKEINKKMKSFINEASGISNRCRKKLLRLVEKHFLVTLPKEDYLNIDIEFIENGNVKMRDEEYKTTSPINNDKELFERFASFETEVNILLKKNETDFDVKKKKGNIANILILFLYLIVALVLIRDGLVKLLIGDFTGIVYIVIMLSYYVVPLTGERLKNRIIQAKRYIKSLINK